MINKRPGWLRRLDSVATTVAQAKQIIRRNQGLLDELKRAEPELLKLEVPEAWRQESTYSTTIGCPHCKASDICQQCAWSKYEGCLDSDSLCSDADFDGLTFAEITTMAPLYVSYDICNESLGVCYWDSCHVDDMADCIKYIRRFLKAHVRWGKDVIKRKGKP